MFLVPENKLCCQAVAKRHHSEKFLASRHRRGAAQATIDVAANAKS